MPPSSTILLWEPERYIYLIYLFAFVVTILMLFLCYLIIGKRRAMEQESQSREYSHLAIEALEAERRRVSRELHDDILPQIQDSALADKIRSICHELMPPDFTRLSLKDSLADLTLQFTEKTSIKCVVFIEETLDCTHVSVDNQLQIFRIAQEAFTNIAKHSGTDKAVFTVRQAGPLENILICISDEGRGLQCNPGITEESGKGIGMKSMRQRADMIGAKLDFINEGGLTVKLEIPVKNPNDK
jgi:two-component system NarL family sensor kinase